MTLPVVVLRPEPGNAATCTRLRDAGCDARAMPLFATEPVGWDVPAAKDFDALLLTSAAAARHAGAGLAALSGLHVHAVGPATADAARVAGLTVASSGSGGAAALLATLPAPLRLLWLAGEERTEFAPPAAITLDTRIVYRARPLSPGGIAGPAIAMLHSAAAAQRLAALAGERGTIRLVAISAAVANAAGAGWHSVAIATRPDDAEMVALAAKLCHDDGEGRAVTSHDAKDGGTA